MKKIDKRIIRTKQQLHQAIIDLVIEKGYPGLSIRDITERAGVGYATFFRHYKDKSGLIQDVLAVVLEDVRNIIRPSTKEADTEQNGILTFKHVAQHAQLYRVLLETGAGDSFLRQVFNTIADDILEKFKPVEGSPIPPKIAAYHVTHASVALIQWWLENDMCPPVEEMGKIYSELIIKPVRRIALQF